MADPFTIRIFVPAGDADGVRLIDRMNWTGLGIAFPRQKWPEIRQRSEFQRAGVYILVGHQDEDGIPTIYIGQADGGDGISGSGVGTGRRLFIVGLTVVVGVVTSETAAAVAIWILVVRTASCRQELTSGP